MIRVCRSLSIHGKKFLLPNALISAPMSQSADIYKLEKKDDEGQTFKNDIPVDELKSLRNDLLNHAVSINRQELNEKYFQGDSNKQLVTFSQDKEILIHDIPSMPKQALCKLLLRLVSSKQRPIPIIRLTCERLSTSFEVFSLAQCSDLLFCMSQLSFRHEALIQKLANHILTQKENFETKTSAVSMLRSIGRLKYRNCELIDTLLQCVMKHKELCTTTEKLGVLKTLAAVNYLSPLGSILLEEMLGLADTDFHSTNSYLDFVWMTVILNNFSQQHISTVLAENFVERLEVSEQPYAFNICCLKLLNINAAAKDLMTNYQGPFLKKQQCLTTVRPGQSKMEAVRGVVDGLSHLYAKKSLIKMNVPTDAGFFVDVELYVEKKASSETKAVNEEQNKKIGITLLDFNDICLDDLKSLDGLSTFKEKILRARNYTVVNIPYDEYKPSMKMFEKIQYLKKKLKDVVES